ncbi:MAG: peptidase dimerization domain-containing protein [Anaerolineae bacterium]|nr:peptidase dimerization domain-containing protein [Anaerolineae bacterium]
MLTQEPTGGVIWNANRGAVTLRITTRGKAAHVGLQHQGVNAFEAMLHVAGALQGLKAEVEQRRTAYRVTPAEAAHSIPMLGGGSRAGPLQRCPRGMQLHPRTAVQTRRGSGCRKGAPL